MNAPRATVVIATRDRPFTLQETLKGLLTQSEPPAAYEIVIVDDGSTPPVSLPNALMQRCRLLRTNGVERSRARNLGAAAARGGVLIFLDDDMTVAPDFVRWHVLAHEEWPETIVTGAIRLPPTSLQTPFGRFRQRLEDAALPPSGGWIAARNRCAAGNMSVRAESFRPLGGFDPALSSSEDQDLAMRFTARGGRLAYLPEASAIHRDEGLDLRRYCRRSEWGMEFMIPFCLRYADWPENLRRAEVNGPVDLGRDGPLRIGLKLLKAALSRSVTTDGLFRLVDLLEWLPMPERVLHRAYRFVLGVHLFRGYRRGLAQWREAPPLPVPTDAAMAGPPS